MATHPLQDNTRRFKGFLFLLISSCIIFQFYSCNTNVDDTDPIIEIINISPSLRTDTVCGSLEENNVIRLSTGATLDLSLEFSDNEALSQYKIDIHENFDCHGHRGPIVNAWQVLEIVDLQGTEESISRSLQVPSNATAGSYHFQIRLLDLSGNEAGAMEAYSILLTNSTDSIAPELRIDSPTQQNLSLNKGEILSINGQALDNNPLEGGRLELVYYTPSGNRVIAETQNFDSNAGTNTNYQFDYSLPMSLVSGLYNFELRIFDAVGNSYFSPSIEVNIN